MTIGLINLRVGYTLVGGPVSGTLAVTEASDIVSFGALQVLFDAASSANGANGGTLAGAVTLTHTPVSPSPSGAIVWVAWYDGEFNTTLTSMIYGSVAMVKNTETIGAVGTRIDHSGGGTGPTDNGNYWKIALYGLASPPAGAQTVTAQFSGLDVYPIMGVITVTGSDVNNIFRNTGVVATGTSTTPGITVPSATGDLVIDVVAGGPSWSGSALDGFNITDLTASGSPNTRHGNQTVTNFGNTNTAAASTSTGASSVTTAWTKAGSASAHWYMVGASVRAANTGWSTIPIGGGGFIDGIDIVPDGTILVRSDTPPSPYLYSGGVWVPLNLASSMPSAYVAPRDATGKLAVGMFDTRICPSFTSKFYMLTHDDAGRLFVTVDSGVTWTQLTNFPAQPATQTNDNYRSYNYRMAVDPQNDAILYVGTYSGGLQRTLDSGATWSTRTVGTGTSTIGWDGNPGGFLIAFDPTSTVISSVTQGLFVARMGDGVYHSTDAGGSFTKLSTTGMPTNCSNLMVASNGTLWAMAQTSALLYKWTSGGGWVNVTTPFGGQLHSFDIDPLDATCQRMAVAAGGGGILTSTNGGTSWNSVYQTNDVTGTDAPWMNIHYTGGTYFITDGKIKFDTKVSGKLWQTWGFGMMYAPNVFANTSSIAFTVSVKGIEGLDATSIIHPPGGNPIGTGYDVPIWNFTSLTSPPTQYKPEGYNNGLNPLNVTSSRGFALDFAKSDPTFIAAICGATSNGSPTGSPTYQGWYSTNKGVNWSPFADQNASFWTNAFGSIAVSTPSNIVAQTGDGLIYTTNGGVTWIASSYAGANVSIYYAQGQRFIAADPTTANKFVMISFNDGIYRSTDSGATFTKISSFIPIKQGFDEKILGIPGHPDHFLLTGGYLDTGTIPQAGNLFYRSTDGGVNWSSIANVGEVWAMDYGTVVSGQSYPTIYLVGYVDRGSGLEFGVWKTIDNFTTFVRLGEARPMGWYGIIADIAGNKDVDGACSIAYFGGGFKTFR